MKVYVKSRNEEMNVNAISYVRGRGWMFDLRSLDGRIEYRTDLSDCRGLDQNNHKDFPLRTTKQDVVQISIKGEDLAYVLSPTDSEGTL